MIQTKLCTDQTDFFSAMYIRSCVFMIEQGVSPLIELDEQDATASHIISYADGTPAATCRILWNGGHAFATLGRLAVMPEYRRTGLGSEVLAFAENLVRTKGISELQLHAQTHARRFYEANGYTPFGELFYEAGIEHVSMKKELL